MGKAALLLVGLLVVALLAGCGGSSMTTSSQPSSAAVSLTMRDTPPSGVTVLSFEITVTGASLQPADASKPSVALVTTPAQVEIKQLETETAFLNTSSVAADTYNSIAVTFANPELTILNNSGQTFVVGNQTCLSGQVCELKPPLNPASVSVTAPTAPFPLTISANSPIGLVLDFDLNASIQNNLSVSPTISFTQIPAVQPTGQLEEIEDLLGQVTAVGSNQFTLKDSTSGQSFMISVDSNTQFEDFDKVGCTANNFSCIKAGQILEVDLHLMANGTFVAKKVELEEDVNGQQVEGTVVSVNAANNQFQMVVVDEEPAVPGVNVGNLVTVSIQTGANFQIDKDDLSIPGGLSFASVNDLLAGQNVEVRPLSVSSSAAGITITTDRVRLHMSQFAAAVASISAPNFAVNKLPSLFTGAGINQVQVQTSSQTEFEGVTGVSALNINDTVSLRGLLFKTAGDPALVAKKVRKR